MKTLIKILLFIVALILSPLLIIGIVWSIIKLAIGMRFKGCQSNRPTRKCNV